MITPNGKIINFQGKLCLFSPTLSGFQTYWLDSLQTHPTDPLNAALFPRNQSKEKITNSSLKKICEIFVQQ